ASRRRRRRWRRRGWSTAVGRRCEFASPWPAFGPEGSLQANRIGHALPPILASLVAAIGCGESAAPAVTAFVRVTAGGFHTCGTTTIGTTYCWGDNLYGELGDGTTTPRSHPALVAV